MIYLTGDTHGEMQMRRLNTENCKAKAKDYVIILGDFGLLWNGTKSEDWWLDWLSGKPFTTLVVDGNHENHEMFQALKEQKKFGSVVGRIRHNIFHLKRGHIYDIEGQSFLAFGGATSIDKGSRREGISWWPGEVPTGADFNRAVDNLAIRGNRVDYILSHTCPDEVAQTYLDMRMIGPYHKIGDPTQVMLSEIVKIAEFKMLYFGHWHENMIIDQKYRMLYEDIVKLGE